VPGVGPLPYAPPFVVSAFFSLYFGSGLFLSSWSVFFLLPNSVLLVRVPLAPLFFALGDFSLLFFRTLFFDDDSYCPGPPFLWPAMSRQSPLSLQSHLVTFPLSPPLFSVTVHLSCDHFPFLWGGVFFVWASPPPPTTPPPKSLSSILFCFAIYLLTICLLKSRLSVCEPFPPLSFHFTKVSFLDLSPLFLVPSFSPPQ